MKSIALSFLALALLAGCAVTDNHKLSDDEIDAAWAKIARDRK